MQKQKKGFTILEILLVIALIGILLGIMLVVLNPRARFASARNDTRQSDIKRLETALTQYRLQEGSYPAGLSSTLQEICDPDIVNPATNCGSYINLSALVPTYIQSIPQDPNDKDTTDGNGYQVAVNITRNIVAVKAIQAESSATISINDPLPAGLPGVATNTVPLADTTIPSKIIVSATGGTESTITVNGVNYKVHTFTTVGTSQFTLNSEGIIEYLIVGGGGGGGNSQGGSAWGSGGGGAGGMLIGSTTLTPQNYTITVGNGGASNSNGGNSSFGTIATAIGGGKGGNAGGGSGGNGGSGGGKGGYSGAIGIGTNGQGNNGGNGPGGDNGGGGGGAGTAGDNTRNGGNGLQSMITGVNTYYAGGGGGGWQGSSGGIGGGGGQNVNGTNGLGGGGGGGSGNSFLGRTGGSGIVIIRYPI